MVRARDFADCTPTDVLALIDLLGPATPSSDTAPCNCNGHSSYCSPDGRCQVCYDACGTSLSSTIFRCRTVNTTLLATTASSALQAIKATLVVAPPMTVNPLVVMDVSVLPFE